MPDQAAWDVFYPGRRTMELILTAEEEGLLVDILERRQRELLKEIAHTDHHEFKLALRRSERLLESMLRRLRNAPARELCG
jgi:hypothetical protein